MTDNNLTLNMIKKSPEVVLRLIGEMEKRNKIQEDVIQLQEKLLKSKKGIIEKFKDGDI